MATVDAKLSQLIVSADSAVQPACACSLRVFDLPSEAYSSGQVESHTSEPRQETSDSFSAALQVQEGELVYDYAWYSCMHTSDPVSCCFATTSRVSQDTALTLLLSPDCIQLAWSVCSMKSIKV